MASLSCLSIYESGAFASGSGNVIIPSADVPFPIEALTTGAATIAFVGSGSGLVTLVGAGSASFAFAGAGVGVSDAVADGSGSFAFAGDGVSLSDDIGTFDSTAITFDATDHTFDEAI